MSDTKRKCLCSMTFGDKMLPAMGKIRTKFPNDEFSIKTYSERIFFRVSLNVVLGFMACHS